MDHHTASSMKKPASWQTIPNELKHQIIKEYVLEKLKVSSIIVHDLTGRHHHELIGAVRQVLASAAVLGQEHVFQGARLACQEVGPFPEGSDEAWSRRTEYEAKWWSMRRNLCAILLECLNPVGRNLDKVSATLCRSSRYVLTQCSKSASSIGVPGSPHGVRR